MISFGNKIEFASCRVLNRDTQNFQNAKLYEFDCADVSDICYMTNKTPKKWKFKKIICEDIKKDYGKKHLKIPKTIKPLKTSRYFIIESNGKPIGVCEAENNEKNLNINYLESFKNEKYKYTARAMLAALAKYNLRENKGTIVIPIPTPCASSYYTNVCGFEEKKNAYLALEHKNPRNFIKENDDKLKIELLV